MSDGDTSPTSLFTVAIIGSFRQHYDVVTASAERFVRAGWTVTSPRCSPVVSGDLFVRFETDDADLTDAEVQSVTLRNIFTAALVYVVNPDGYVGRTTCYELGRIIQRRQPVYFLARPFDLPVEIPDWAIQPPDRLIEILNVSRKPHWLYHDSSSYLAEIERAL